MPGPLATRAKAAAPVAGSPYQRDAQEHMGAMPAVPPGSQESRDNSGREQANGRYDPDLGRTAVLVRSDAQPDSKGPLGGPGGEEAQVGAAQMALAKFVVNGRVKATSRALLLHLRTIPLR